MSGPTPPRAKRCCELRAATKRCTVPAHAAHACAFFLSTGAFPSSPKTLLQKSLHRKPALFPAAIHRPVGKEGPPPVGSLSFKGEPPLERRFKYCHKSKKKIIYKNLACLYNENCIKIKSLIFIFERIEIYQIRKGDFDRWQLKG